MPVAYEVARALGAPPEVLGVRKIGALGKPELGTGAVPEGGVRVLVHGTVRRLLVGHEGLEAATARAGAEVDARVERYRGERRPIDVKGRTAIIVDDGLATGGTAALRAVRAQAPAGSSWRCRSAPRTSSSCCAGDVDLVACLLQPELPFAVGL